MKKISVKLITGGHCIQSAAKYELKNISAMIMESEDRVSPVLTEQFELLTEFLEKTDFNKLRASDERYSGTVGSVCILSKDKKGNFKIKF